MELCGISGQPYDECDGLHEDECVWQCGQCGGNVYNCICPNEKIPEWAIDPRRNGSVVGVDVASGKDETVKTVVEINEFFHTFGEDIMLPRNHGKTQHRKIVHGAIVKNDLDAVIRLLVKFGDAALFSDAQIGKAANQLTELEFELLQLRQENIELKARLGTNRAQVKAMATEKRRRTQRALDVCPACAGKGNIQIGVYSETCSACHGTGTRQ